MSQDWRGTSQGFLWAFGKGLNRASLRSESPRTVVFVFRVRSSIELVPISQPGELNV